MTREDFSLALLEFIQQRPEGSVLREIAERTLKDIQNGKGVTLYVNSERPTYRDYFSKPSLNRFKRN